MQPRVAGVSLIEVLISMGVLAIGLLGAAALFPVGGHYLRQGDVSDRSDALAQSALNDAIARGMLDPERWLAARPGAATGNRPSVFDREFASVLRDARAARSAAFAGNDINQSADEAIREINALVGSIFVVDPLGAAAAMDPSRAASATFPSGFVAGSMGMLPASTNPTATWTNNTNANLPGWYPWTRPSGTVNHPDPLPSRPEVQLVESWPVRRMSVATGALPILLRPEAPMVSQAESMVMMNDDLAIELNDYTGNPFEANPDNPSQQRWTSTPTSTPAKRQFRGDFSWLLTVVPTTPEARDALATDPESHSYDVSAVVSYKRAIGGEYAGFTSSDFFGHDSIMLGERQVRAAIATTGVGGGQLQIFNDTGGEVAAASTAESPIEQLRDGQWVMLFGPHPDSTVLRPLMFCQWYRVIAVEGETSATASLFVRGPDWPWNPLDDGDDDETTAPPGLGIQNDLRVVIMPDVVSVHTRTMQLNAGSAWGLD